MISCLSMRAPPWRAVLAAALLALAAARIIMVTREGLSGFQRDTRCRDGTDYNSEAGEALFHGLPLPQRISWSMPAYSLGNALVCHAHGGRELLLPASALWLEGSLVFAIGRLLSGALGGSGAAVLFTAALDPDDAFNERWAYVLAVLLVGFAAVRRSRRPSAVASAWFGASVGASFLFLSSLILYPFAAELVDWAGRRRREGLRAWGKTALALLTALAFLAPWTAMNWRLRREVVLLERGRADTNVITGAAGLLTTVGAEDPRALTGFPGGGSALRWAVLEVLRHPGRFARAGLARAAFISKIHPVLLSLAVLGFILRRRSPEAAALALLALCYAGAHCLMPVERRYLTPLWPLAAALAAAILPAPGFRRTDRLAGVAPALPAMLSVAAFILWVWTLCLAYPGRSSAASALERELAQRPSEAWLWSYRGDSLLRAQRPGEAEAALERALSLQPQSDVAYRLALARAVVGKDPGRPVPSQVLEAAVNWPILTALWNVGRGEMKAARRDFADALHQQEDMRLRRAGGGENASISSRSKEAARIKLEKEILVTIRLWPISGQPRLLRGLRDLGRVEGEVLIAPVHLLTAVLDQGAAALAASRTKAAAELFALALELKPEERLGDLAGQLTTLARLEYAAERPAAARAAIAMALRSRPAAPLLESIVIICQNNGDFKEALKVLDGPLRSRPTPRWHNDRGVALACLRRAPEAMREFEAAIAADADLLTSYLSLGILLDRAGRSANALQVYERALGRPSPASLEDIQAQIRQERDRLRLDIRVLTD